MIDELKVKNMFENLLKEKKVKEYLKELKNHHKETYEHSIRVGLLCIYLGYRNSFNEDEIELLGYAGLLHDIGKKDISQEILSKKSKLNKEEELKIKEHPRNGFIKLKASGMENIAKIIIAHHEYKNKSYPRSIKSISKRKANSKIKILSEIVAVADMYDALSSKRPYNKKFTKEEIEYILKNHFIGDKKYIKQLIETKCQKDLIL